MHTIFTKFQDQLIQTYFPTYPEAVNSLSENLISPFVLHLPHNILDQAKSIVRDLNKLSQSPLYREQLNFDFTKQQTPSLLNSLDVHLDRSGKLKTIEINTNASMYLLANELYKTHGLKQFLKAEDSLTSSFKTTFKEHISKKKYILIVDEQMKDQKLMIDFLVFKSFIEQKFQVSCDIADVNDLEISNYKITYKGTLVDGIYNRYCDFYFQNHPNLKSAYTHKETLISPNPTGYTLLADKNRLLMWNEKLFKQLKDNENLDLSHLQESLPKIMQVTDPETIWPDRKKYFFKPPQSYGSKAVYNGKSISRSLFNKIINETYLAQETVPPPKVNLKYNGDSHSFKYDLRFYFFEDKIQLGVARLYQGQLTNAQTPLGGLAPLHFIG